MSRLIKKTTTTYIPGVSGTAATPSSPAQSAYCTTQPVTTCGTRMVLDPLGPTSGSYEFVTSCTTSDQLVCYPAVAATDGTAGVSPTPEQIAVSLNSGWNTYASSIGPLAVGYSIKFTIKAGTEGALLGVAYPGFEGQPIQAFPVGIMVDGSGIYVFESGAKSTFLGVNAPGTEVRIARLNDGRIMYVASTGAFKISALTYPVTDTLVVYGLLYSGGDEVSSSAFVAGNLLSEPSATLRGAGTLIAYADQFVEATMLGVGSQTAQAGATGTVVAIMTGAGTQTASTANTQSASLVGRGTLTALAKREQMVEATHTGRGSLLGTAQVGGRGFATLGLLQVFGGDTAYAEGLGILPSFTGSANGGIFVPPALARGYANLPFITAWALGRDRVHGNASATLAPLISLAGGYPFGFGYGELPRLLSVGRGGFVPRDTMVLVSTSVSMMTLEQQRDLVLFLNSEGQIQSTLTLTREQALSMVSSLQTQSTLSILGVYGYTLLSDARGLSLQTLSVGGRPDLPTTGVVWVVNTETQASSQYESYSFNSFIKRNGVCYGVAADGIYKLEGVTDAGAQVDALAYLGRLDFGTALKKLLPNIYLGVASGAPMKLDVNADGTTYTYEARSSEATTIKNHRVDLGRGLKANTLGLTVKNKSGAEFELATVEVLPAPTTRRI